MSRTEYVYRLCQQDAAHLWATKGVHSLPQPIMTRKSTYTGGTVAFQHRLTSLDVTYFKDVLAGYVNAGTWFPFQGVGKDYVQQVAAEKKCLVDRKTKVSTGEVTETWLWVPKSAAIPNHFFDCEVLALAAARSLDAGKPAKPINDYPAMTDQHVGGWKIGR